LQPNGLSTSACSIHLILEGCIWVLIWDGSLIVFLANPQTDSKQTLVPHKHSFLVFVSLQFVILRFAVELRDMKFYRTV
jgi:hypothetical protein